MKKILVVFMVLSLAVFAIFAQGTDESKGAAFPDDDIMIYCQFGAGGGNDVQLRAIAPYLQKYLPNDVNVVVDNKTGGGGIVCSNYIWASKPTGYTLMQAQMGTMLTQQMYSREISFDCEKFTWLGIYAFDKSVLVVRPDLPINNWDELVAYSEQNTLRFATAGAGSNTHVQAEMFLEAAGIKANLVHYSDGTAGVVAAFGRGEVDAYIFSLGNQSIAAEKNGTVRTLCILQQERSDFIPDVPTITEIGSPSSIVAKILANPIISAPRGFCGPADMNEEVVSVIDTALMKALNDPEMIAWGKKNMLSWDPKDAAETQAWVSENLKSISAYKGTLVELMK
ncbi:MAG: Bug family tripartite tricarboxylate transporter substrate binding protein [Sphaerochaetaceae bacterium]